MKRTWCSFPQLILLCLLLSSLVFVFPAVGVQAANPGLRVSGAILVTEVSPGETLNHKMVVGIGDTDQPADIIVQIGNIGQALDGGYLLNTPSSASEFSANSYITADITDFYLEPGATQNVNLTIRVPENVGEGGIYALVNVRTAPRGTGNVGMISAVNIPIYLTIKNTRLIHTGKITELKAENAESGKPVGISTLFQNTGNHHFKVKGDVVVSDSDGKTLDTLIKPLSGSSVLPGLIRELKATYIPQGKLATGIYHVKSRVMMEDGTVLDEASGQFEVKIPYVPPPPAASITVIPSSPAVLQTDDGRISIAFPKGAVISQAGISIDSYPPEQLREPPQGYTLASTCFRVDGLTGLLAKEAVVTVKYSEADLDKAGGDASRLALARWDESAGQWTPLKTSLDENAMTLSASTNQFSIWAVLVGAPASAGLSLVPVICIVAAVVVLLVLIFVFFKIVRPKLHHK
jgi:hypothetical protein